MERRLAAILTADVVGYSRLMGDDEAGTLQRFKTLLADFLRPLIATYHGRIVKLMGDGILVEFHSVVDAVTCGIAWQSKLMEQHQESPKENCLTFRIGLHVGDIIADGDDIYGDGVNVASRLESLAGVGGICLSEDAYRQVRGKIAVKYHDRGEHELKNIAQKMRIFDIDLRDSGGLDSTTSETESPIDIPAIPSIAILPFENSSSDPEQDFLSDGMAEDITTALSKSEKLFVVASASTAAYRGRRTDPTTVSREQGVRYILDGRLRKVADRVRVSLNLIDASSNQLIWAERYDRTLTDIFALQDEIAREVVIALEVKLVEGEQARLWAGGTRDVVAWELHGRARELEHHQVREDTLKARELIEKALALDPNYARAWCALGWTHCSEAHHRWGRSVEESWAKARAAAGRARHLSQADAEPLALFARIALGQERYQKAEDFTDQALRSCAGQSNIIATLAMNLSHCGRPDEAIIHLERAMRLCPIYPNWYRVVLGRACLMAGDHEKAITMLRIWQKNEPEPVVPVLLAVALYDANKKNEAREILIGALRNRPTFTIESWAQNQTFKRAEDLARMTSVLRECGVPA